MAQIKVVSWTNPATAVARNEDVGFTVSEALVTNLTDGVSYYWNSGFSNGYYQTVSSGAITTSNGFTPLAQSTAVGASISGFTNANPGVITVNDTAVFGFAAGDTIQVSEVADDLSGTLSLNGSFTIASITATTITLVEDTSVTGYSVWVSGGKVVRVSDTNGVAIAEQNFAIRGMTLGTGVVGTNTDSMVAVFRGDNVVV